MSDPNKIEEMIAGEPDPKNRAFLLILNNINNALVENTATTKEVAAALEAHILEYKAHAEQEKSLLDKGRGAWKIAAWCLGIAQFVALGIYSDARKELREIHADQQEARIERTEMKGRLSALETLERRK